MLEIILSVIQIVASVTIIILLLFIMKHDEE